MIRVCSTGSIVLGLVDQIGDRVDGPCPALKPMDDGGFACGLVLRPKDYIKSDRGVTSLRDAVKILIGAGVGCDEAGDEPDETYLPKARRLEEEYVKRHGVSAIQRAADIVIRGK